MGYQEWRQREMKKIKIIAVIFILGITGAGIPVIADQTSTEISRDPSEWTGAIRIEGKNKTIWEGEVTVSSSTIVALNESTQEMEEYIIDHPSVLGALDEASKQGGFSYDVTYYPLWNAFFVTSIGNDSSWWHYWVDYTLPMIDAGTYELSEGNAEVLWGYVEDWYPHALRISVEKTEVRKNEKFLVSVFNETMSPVKNATVYVGAATYITNDKGLATVKIAEKGIYEIYADKRDSVRSKKVSVQVKKLKTLKIWGNDTHPIHHDTIIVKKNTFPLFKKLLEKHDFLLGTYVIPFRV